MRRILAAGLTASTVAMIAIAAPALAQEWAGSSARPDEKTAALTDLDLSESDHLVALHCRGRVTDRGPAVGCGWRADQSVEVSGWQLWRLRIRPASDGRELVAELDPDVTGYTDTTVTSPATYIYVVLGTDRAGEVIARSRPALVPVAQHPQGVIDLGCHLRWDPAGPDDEPRPVDAVDSVRRPAIGCRWEPSDRADIQTYTVLRSVDGGPRSVIAEVGADVTSIVDGEVAFGHSYTYLVQGRDHEGHVVAHSRPVKVGIPRWHRDWPTDRLHDRVVDRVDGGQIDRVPDHETDRVTDRATDRATDGEHDSSTDLVGDPVRDETTDAEPERAVTDGHAGDSLIERSHDAEPERAVADGHVGDQLTERSHDAEPPADLLPAHH